MTTTTSTFASELAAAKAAPVAEATTTPEAAAPAAIIPGTEHFNGVAAKPAPEAVEATLATEPVAPAAAKPKAKVKIGSQEFDDVDQAIAYAQDLELSVIQSEAFNAGKAAATPAVPAAAVKTLEDKIADKLFDDPKGALEEYKKAIIDEVKASIHVEATQKATIKNTWDNFYEKNSDLSGHDEVVNYVLQKNWNELGHIKLELGLEKLAEKTRAFLGSYKQQALPTRELSSKPAVTPMGGTPTTATTEEKPATALDFVKQMAMLRKKSSGS